jgi:Cu2+-exporting ATPase
MAAPLSVVGALAICAHKGIVVKDARALELMNEVDSVVFARDAPLDVVQGLRSRGIQHIAIVRSVHDAAGSVDAFHREGRKVCFVGDGIDDAVAMGMADVSVSLRGASSIVDDAANAVFLQGRASLLLDWLDTARALGRNFRRAGPLILVPNVAFVAGAFAMGFGIMASVLTNNLAALAALGHAVLPLREVAQLEAERRHHRQISLAVATAARCDQAFEPATGGAEPGDSDVGRSELAMAGAAVYDGDA